MPRFILLAALALALTPLSAAAVTIIIPMPPADFPPQPPDALRDRPAD
jgi:hypothetical protein